MASLNDISTSINQLFNDITEPITLGLNKTNLFKRYKSLTFSFENNNNLEFRANPILSFESERLLENFLKRENTLAERYDDLSFTQEIKTLLKEKRKTPTLDNFYLEYTIDVNERDIYVVFNTNCLVFKYELIG